jgi:hypothetical protein
MYIMHDMLLNNKCVNFIMKNIFNISNNMLVKILLLNMDQLELEMGVDVVPIVVLLIDLLILLIKTKD